MPKKVKSSATRPQQQQQQKQQEQHAKGSDGWSRLQYSRAIEAYFNGDYRSQAIILTEFLVNTPPEHDLYVAAAVRLSECPSLKSSSQTWADINYDGLLDRTTILADSNVHMLPTVILGYTLFLFHRLRRSMDDAILQTANLSDHVKHQLKKDSFTMAVPFEISTSINVLASCNRYHKVFQAKDPKFLCPDPSNLRQDVLVSGSQLVSTREHEQLKHLINLGLLPNKDPSLLDVPDLQLANKLGSIMGCYVLCSTCQRQPPLKGALMKCGRCKLKRYCSAQCQKADWDRGHKTVCRSRENIEEGDFVRVSGLAQASHLNGMFFILKRRAESAGRWTVGKLGDIKEYSIKEENITRVATALELSVYS